MILKVVFPVFAFLGVIHSIPMALRKSISPLAVIPFKDDLDGLDYRLPNNTVPIRYDVSLKTDVHRGDKAFTGTVKITIRALENTNEITLHYRQLTIESIDLFTNPTTLVLLEKNVYYDEKSDVEFLIIQSKNQLIVNQIYVVEIKYHGILRDDNKGFYLSTYQNPQGQTIWLATTQFESTDARHAFPCYDEPQIRTPFGIQIKHDVGYDAISNMPVMSRINETGTNYVVTKFQDTLKVQTYLIAFVVSNFKYIASSDTPKQHRVYAKPQSIEKNEASLALEAGKKLLDKFMEHLNVTYSLPKIDQVAIPDFDAGAMENWGLVTYREEYLLFNEGFSTTQQRENIITIISHEFAVSFQV